MAPKEQYKTKKNAYPTKHSISMPPPLSNDGFYKVECQKIKKIENFYKRGRGFTKKYIYVVTKIKK